MRCGSPNLALVMPDIFGTVVSKLRHNLTLEKMSDKNEICIVATVIAKQVFNFSEDAPSDDELIKGFEAVKLTLDPAPPCDWKYELSSVHIDVTKGGNTVSRNFSLALIINIDQSSINNIKKMMVDEGYYDDAVGFDWSGAINFLITDTTIAPEYADFFSEDVDIDVMELGS